MGELEGDTILESEYILLLAWLGRHTEPVAVKAARYIAQAQLPEGGWAAYPDGPVDPSISVKAYFAMKLAGHDPHGEPMRRACRAIRAAGGADAINSFTRFYLALLGQIPFDCCPAVPPEMVLLPDWAPVHVYRMSSWSRTIFVPLSIVWAHRPVRPVPDELGIAELCLKSPEDWPELQCPGGGAGQGAFSWSRLFRRIDRTFKWLEHRGLRPARGVALRRAEQWMLDRFVDSDGLGAIFPPIIWSVIALECLGYPETSAEVRYCHEQLEALAIERAGTVRLQPCKSPVWDTAITLRALAAAGISPGEPAVRRAIGWLLDKEATRRGDWGRNVDAEPGGWFFEHHNAFYPDTDDTAMVLMALREQLGVESGSNLGASDDPIVAAGHAEDAADARRQVRQFDRALGACRRAVDWLRAMQNRDGGWGAFDKDNDSEFLCQVPFADHNAMIDPSTPDLSARVVEALAAWGLGADDPAQRRAIDYLRATAEPDGSWFGRWGVNYVYGTWQTITGLVAAGVSTDDTAVRAGAAWLVRHQQPDGGWGESPATYDDPTLRGTGPTTASQTAWALLGLIATGRHDHESVRRGVRFLVDRQQDDGSWDEPEFTGTGFPRVFYLKYHLYAIYFPLLALAQWSKAVSGDPIKTRSVSEDG